MTHCGLRRAVPRNSSWPAGLILLAASLNLGFMGDWTQLVSPSLVFMLGIAGVIYAAISFFFIPFGLAIMCVAMLFSPEIGLGAVGSRLVAVRIEDLLIPVLFLAWIARAAIWRRTGWLTPSPLNRPIFFLLVLSLVSTLLGFFRGWVELLPAFFHIGKTVEFFLIFYLFLGYARTERQIKIFLFFGLVTVALLALYTLWQVPQAEIFTDNRITAPFEGRPNPGTAGGYMAFFLIILLSLLINEPRPLAKWGIGLLALLVFIPFLFTFSRTSYAAFLGGVTIVSIVAKKKWLGVLIALSLLLSPLLLPLAVKERIAFTWEDAKNPRRVLGVDYSFQERIFSFERSWNAVRTTNPLMGLGVTSWEYPDNQYARTLHELGILGLVLWLWIYLRLFKIGRWLYFSLGPGLLKGFALGYSAGVACILLHGFGSATFYVVRIMEPFWFISGLAVSLYLIKVREGMETGVLASSG